MSKTYQLCGLASAIVDILVKVPEEFLERFDCTKGGMVLVEQASQSRLIEELSAFSPEIVSGGSVANSLVAFTQIGGAASFITAIGEDSLGRVFKSEFDQLRIEIANPLLAEKSTGSCVVMITPDAERTMRTCLAVNSEISRNSVNHAAIADSELLFIEGYLIASEKGKETISHAIQLAKENKTKIALTLSDAFIVNLFKDYIFEILPSLNYVFANHIEVQSLFPEISFEAAREKLADLVPNVLVTAGAEGAYYLKEGHELHVPAFKCEPVDLTGAGDMFAGAMLYGILNKKDPINTMQAACFLASKVICKVGARLENTLDYYNEIIK